MSQSSESFGQLDLMTIRLRNFLSKIITVREDVGSALDRLSGRSQPNYDVRCRMHSFGSGDGRWFLQPSLTANSIVYSVGIGYDISFDLDVIKKFGCQLHAFDPTVLSKKWLAAQRLPGNFHFHSIGLAHYDGVASFRLPPNHSVSFSMAQSVAGGHEHKAEVRKLGSLMQELKHQRIDVLKIDIEGAEYDIIEDVVAQAGNIGQLLLEFHSRMIPERGEQLTQQAIKRLKDAGFRLYHVSRRGLEHSFLGPKEKVIEP